MQYSLKMIKMYRLSTENKGQEYGNQAAGTNSDHQKITLDTYA